LISENQWLKTFVISVASVFKIHTIEPRRPAVFGSMMVVVIVVVVVVVLLPAGRFRSPRLGALDGGLADKEIPVDRDAATDRLAGLGMFLQRRVLDGLAEFELAHLFAGARKGFIDVGEHGEGGGGKAE
jgi:hypothetical protein